MKAAQQNTEKWYPTPRQRTALQEGLRIVEQAMALLQAMRPQGSPEDFRFFEEWIASREQAADGIQQTFDYFLSGQPIHAAHIFAAWISHPAHLLEEVQECARFHHLELQSTCKEVGV